MGQNEVLYRSLAENALDAIYVISPSNGFEYVNPAFVRIFGYPAEEVCRENFNFLRLVHPNDRKLIAKRQEARAKSKNVPSLYEFRTITKEGKSKFVEVNSVPLPGRENKILGILRDVTERKEIETKLKAYRRRLIASQKELKRFSHRMLSIREEERKKLSAILHDEVGSISIWLNSCLVAIEQGIRDGHLNDALKTIARCKPTVRKMVSRLKIIAADLRPPDLEITGLAEAVREYFVKIMKTIDIRIDFQADLGKKWIDDSVGIILYRIIQEALNNIIQHARARRVKVALSSWRKGVKLDVRDDGVGFRIKNKTWNSRGHLGILGMREMAESLGGSFHLETGAGKGTQISINLPSRRRPSSWP